MTFIKLTTSGGHEFLVNLRHVTSIAESQSSGRGAVITFSHGNGTNVRESITRIWQLIQNARSSA